MKEAMLSAEEALAVVKSSSDVKSYSGLLPLLQKQYQMYLHKYEAVELEDDFEVYG